MNSAHSEDLLNSWKEIASYLNRGIRTVQRWEVELGMPVRRPRGKDRSAVIAVRSELDAWLKACPMSERAAATHRNGKSHQVVYSLEPAISELSELRSDIRHHRQEMRAKLDKLISTIEQIKNR